MGMNLISGTAANVSIALVSIALTLVASEVVFRGLLFSDASFMLRFRDPSLYAATNPENDNYWKLHYLFNADGRMHVPKNPHPLLGWGDKFSRETYLHQSAAEMGSRRGVLLYGDSFAGCANKTPDERTCFQGILNTDNDFSRGHFLLNYGIGGYGLDQIYLLLKNSLHLYHRPFVIVSLMTKDLDRSLLTARGAPKPYFQLSGDDLVLQGTPVPSDASSFYAEHPPEIPSFVYRLILSNHWRMPAGLLQYLESKPIDENRAAVIALNQRILEKIVDEVKTSEYVFLIFHDKGSLNDNDDWRDSFLIKWLTDRQISYVSSKDLIRADASKKNKKLSEYYLPDDDGHPSVYQNSIIANELKRIILGEARP
jgi:hypothetical protein